MVVRIQPVTGDPGPVIETLMRFLGPDSRDRAEQLIATGGVVIKGLNRQAADRIAALLESAGAMAFVEQGESGISAFTVVVLDRASNQPVPGARVEVLGDGEPFATGVSDAAGEAAFERFEQLRREAFGDQRPEITVQVQRQGQPVKVVHKPFRWEMFDATDGILRFLVSAAAPVLEEKKKDFIVLGRIVLGNGEPAPSVTVHAYDRDLRSETLLGQATTGEEGRYEIRYNPIVAEAKEHGGPDLVLRAFVQTGRRLAVAIEGREARTVGEHQIIFNAEPEEEVNLRIATEDAAPTRYEEVRAALEPLLGDEALEELASEDILFLHYETGLPLREVAFVIEDARLRQQASLPAAVFFGLGMQGIGVLAPDADDQPPTIDLPTLLDETIDSLVDAVRSAIEGHLIPAELQDDLDAIRARFEALKETNRA